MPLVNIALRMMGEKVTGKIDDNTKTKIAQEIAKILCKYNHNIDYDYIFKRIFHGDMKEIIHMGFLGAKGIYHPFNKTIYLDKHTIESVLKGDFGEGSAIHESLHKLQGGKLFFQGKEIRGFIEGATEYITQKVQGIKSSSKGKNYDGKIIRLNYKDSPYILDMSIINQIEIILGDDSIFQLALTGDTTALKRFQEIYGKELYEKIRKATNIMSKYPNLDLFMEVQNEILYKCYDQKFEQIQNVQDAKNYLEELRRFELARGKVEGDNIFRDYYTKKYNQLMQMAQRSGGNTSALQDLEYEECRINKIYENNEEELKEMMKNGIAARSIKNVSEVKRFEIKRYEIKSGENSYNILLQNDVPFLYAYIGDYEYVFTSFVNNRNEIHLRDGSFINVNISKNKDGKLDVSLPYTDADGKVQVQNMTEVDLGISQEELDEKVKRIKEEDREFEERFSKKSIFSKLFSRKNESTDVKALPEPETKTRKSWELTEEEKRRIDESRKKNVNKGKTQEGKKDIGFSLKKNGEPR